MAKGCLLLCFACQCYPRDSLVCVQQQGKAVQHLPQQLCQHFAELCATYTCQLLQWDLHWGPAAQNILPVAAAAPSKTPSPSSASTLAQAGPGCGPRCFCSSPHGGFSHPNIALCSKPPYFHMGPPQGGNIFCLLLFSSVCTRNSAVLASAESHSFSPTLDELRGMLPALPRGQLAEHSALPRPNRKGLGSRSPARVPGAWRSCLASILSRYKTLFQKVRAVSLARDRSC